MAPKPLQMELYVDYLSHLYIDVVKNVSETIAELENDNIVSNDDYLEGCANDICGGNLFSEYCAENINSITQLWGNRKEIKVNDIDQFSIAIDLHSVANKRNYENVMIGCMGDEYGSYTFELLSSVTE